MNKIFHLVFRYLFLSLLHLRIAKQQGSIGYHYSVAVVTDMLVAHRDVFGPYEASW